MVMKNVMKSQLPVPLTGATGGGGNRSHCSSEGGRCWARAQPPSCSPTLRGTDVRGGAGPPAQLPLWAPNSRRRLALCSVTILMGCAASAHGNAVTAAGLGLLESYVPMPGRGAESKAEVEPNCSTAEARPAARTAPWSVRRALLTPQVNPGSLYRRGMSS